MSVHCLFTYLADSEQLCQSFKFMSTSPSESKCNIHRLPTLLDSLAAKCSTLFTGELLTVSIWAWWGQQVVHTGFTGIFFFLKRHREYEPEQYSCGSDKLLNKPEVSVKLSGPRENSRQTPLFTSMHCFYMLDYNVIKYGCSCFKRKHVRDCVVATGLRLFSFNSS